MKLSPPLAKSTVIASLGGLLFGFNTAVISGTTDALTRTYSLTPLGLGFTVASAPVGTILGAMLAGIPGNRFGCRDSLRVMAVLYLVSALGCAFAWSWSCMIFFRFLAGLGIGGSSVLGPIPQAPFGFRFRAGIRGVAAPRRWNRFACVAAPCIWPREGRNAAPPNTRTGSWTRLQATGLLQP
jgi:MFS family permease